MADIEVVSEPEPEVHPSEQGPFDAGKVLQLGEQPVAAERPVTGMAATDVDAAKADAVTAFQEIEALIQSKVDALSTNPSHVTAGARSTMNFLLSQVKLQITTIGG